MSTNVWKRKIRLRLHGTRLPKNYTISLRLASSNNRGSQPKKPARKRRRKTPSKTIAKHSSDSDEGSAAFEDAVSSPADDAHSDAEGNAEQIRLNNAYTGTSNTIGSIHQRTWYISLDKLSSGFIKQRSKGHTSWVRGNSQDVLNGFETFFVRGRERERSVVTGRLAIDILRNEGVEGYMGRAGWRPILQ